MKLKQLLKIFHFQQNITKLFCTISTIILLNLLSSTSHALSPEPRLKNPEQEKRARQLFLEIRCLVCSGQVIESSNNEFAASMREFVRNEIKSGKSNAEIKDNLISKYGPDIIISNTPKHHTIFLIWLLPTIFIIALGYAFVRKATK